MPASEHPPASQKDGPTWQSYLMPHREKCAWWARMLFSLSGRGAASLHVYRPSAFLLVSAMASAAC